MSSRESEYLPDMNTSRLKTATIATLIIMVACARPPKEGFGASSVRGEWMEFTGVEQGVVIIPEGAAARELYEETGYRAKEMVNLGSVHSNPAVFNNICHTFLAKDVYPAGNQEMDDKEDIEVVIKPLAEIPRLIKEGEITHSLILAAFYRFCMEYKNKR